MSSSLNVALSFYLKVWDWDEESYLFPGNRNEPIQAHTLELAIRKYNLSREVTKTSTHLFRHTFAKNYILAGVGMICCPMDSRRRKIFSIFHVDLE